MKPPETINEVLWKQRERENQASILKRARAVLVARRPEDLTALDCSALEEALEGAATVYALDGQFPMGPGNGGVSAAGAAETIAAMTAEVANVEHQRDLALRRLEELRGFCRIFGRELLAEVGHGE